MAITIAIPFLKSLKLYIRNPFKLIKKEEIRTIEDEEELLSVYGKPNVSFVEPNVSFVEQDKSEIFFPKTPSTFVMKVPRSKPFNDKAINHGYLNDE